MAVFMLNICKFNDCGLTFKSLGDLIQHIEETHIDYDPRVIEQTEQQQPTCIPLSYVLRFLTDAARKEVVKPVNQSRSNQTCLAPSTRNKNNTPTGSEAEEGEDFVSEPEDSNDSWTTSSEFSADFILRYGSRIVSQNTPSQNNSSDKPFACPVPGCKKRYKNINGIKYHSKNGHKNDGKVRKGFKCPCGKSYKTSYGFKNHGSIQHGNNPLPEVKVLQKNNKITIKLESDWEESSTTTTTTTTSSIIGDDANSQSTITTPSLQSSNTKKISKCKVSAIEDHGYNMKQDRSVKFENDDLGILTPASSPPLPSNTSIKCETVSPRVRSVQKLYPSNISSSQINYPNIKVGADNN